MRHLRESAIQKKVVEYARKDLGLNVIKLNPMGQNGWPDLLVILPHGRTLFLEMKRPGEEPRKLQLHIHEMLRKDGQHVEVAETHEEGKRIVAAALARAQNTAPGRLLRKTPGDV